MLSLSFSLASLIYHTVERPFHYKRYLSSEGFMALGYGAGILATIAMFIGVNFADGVPQRFPPQVVALANYVNDQTESLPDCVYNAVQNLDWRQASA